MAPGSVRDPPVRGLLAHGLLVPTKPVVRRAGVQAQDLSLLVNPEGKCGHRRADEEPAKRHQRSHQSLAPTLLWARLPAAGTTSEWPGQAARIRHRESANQAGGPQLRVSGHRQVLRGGRLQTLGSNGLQPPPDGGLAINATESVPKDVRQTWVYLRQAAEPSSQPPQNPGAQSTAARLSLKGPGCPAGAQAVSRLPSIRVGLSLPLTPQAAPGAVPAAPSTQTPVQGQTHTLSRPEYLACEQTH